MESVRPTNCDLRRGVTFILSQCHEHLADHEVLSWVSTFIHQFLRWLGNCGRDVSYVAADDVSARQVDGGDRIHATTRNRRDEWPRLSKQEDGQNQIHVRRLSRFRSQISDSIARGQVEDRFGRTKRPDGWEVFTFPIALNHRSRFMTDDDKKNI